MHTRRKSSVSIRAPCKSTNGSTTRPHGQTSSHGLKDVQALLSSSSSSSSGVNALRGDGGGGGGLGASATWKELGTSFVLHRATRRTGSYCLVILACYLVVLRIQNFAGLGLTDSSKTELGLGQLKKQQTRKSGSAVVETTTFDVSHDPPWVLAGSHDSLPKCQKLFLFTFTGRYGFASEWILYMRAAAAADRLGYTFVEDDSKWNYGRLTDYFEPRVLSCIPPTNWAKTSAAVEFGSGKWRGKSRLYTSRSSLTLSTSREMTDEDEDEEYLDTWEYETYLEPRLPLLQELWETNERYRVNGSRHLLAPWDGLPRAMDAVFQTQSKMTKKLWVPSTRIEEEIKRVEKELDVISDRPIVGVHVRLGDKREEWEGDAESAAIRNVFGNLTVHLQAAHDAYARLIGVHPPRLTITSPLYSPDALPSLIVMTAEEGVLETLLEHPLSDPFELSKTPSPPIPEGEKPHFDQFDFNAWKVQARVEHTKSLVRDLTMLARDADALIVSGASSIGKLAMLLAGFDATVGPPSSHDPHTHPYGGRIRSIDHWYSPLSDTSLVFHDVDRDQPIGHFTSTESDETGEGGTPSSLIMRIEDDGYEEVSVLRS